MLFFKALLTTVIGFAMAAPSSESKSIEHDDEFYLMVISTNYTLNGKYVVPYTTGYTDTGAPIMYALADSNPVSTYSIRDEKLYYNYQEGQSYTAAVGRYTDPTGFQVVNVLQDGERTGFSWNDRFLQLDYSQNWYACWVDNPLHWAVPTITYYYDPYDAPGTDQCAHVLIQYTPLTK